MKRKDRRKRVSLEENKQFQRRYGETRHCEQLASRQRWFRRSDSAEKVILLVKVHRLSTEKLHLAELPYARELSKRKLLKVFLHIVV